MCAGDYCLVFAVMPTVVVDVLRRPHIVCGCDLVLQPTLKQGMLASGYQIKSQLLLPWVAKFVVHGIVPFSTLDTSCSFQPWDVVHIIRHVLLARVAAVGHNTLC